MKKTNSSLTARPAWKALVAHHKKIRNVHLRQLFADDPKRGERLTVEAAGLFLDYSKNRITDETLKLLLKLAEECGLRSASTPCSTVKRSTSRKIARSCTSPCARREAHRSWWTARTSFPTCTKSSTRWSASPTASAAAIGRATPASASGT